jgi:CRP-like cAMP-binding protein
MKTFELNTKSLKCKFDLKRPEVIELFELFQKSPLLLKTNQILFKENSLPVGIYYINKGIIKIVKIDAKGKEKIFQNSRAGSLLGMNSLMKEKKHCYTAIAVVPSEILYVSKNDFMRLLSSNPVVSKYILINLCKQLEDTESIIEECYSENESRIADAIIILSANLKQGKLVDSFKLSVSNLSGVTGIADEQIKQILIDFEERKLVTMQRNIVTTANIAGLKTICKNKSNK